MYIADLTEVLCRKKRLQGSSADWVLCLADLTLALPLDRTVASLEGRIDLALVRRQWAVEHGLRIGDRRGGDPSGTSAGAIILCSFSHCLSVHLQADVGTSALGEVWRRYDRHQSGIQGGFGIYSKAIYVKLILVQKYRVQRKIAIGRHERVLAIDGDYIHVRVRTVALNLSRADPVCQIMPSESRAFFDSMKTTSFHVSLVASCKLTGRAGGFKINVWREGNQKRYEFEAENGRQAGE